MKRQTLVLLLVFSAVWAAIFFPQISWANNLKITNLSLEDRDPEANTVVVEFDLAWENSWRDAVNWDAVWVFFKISKNEAEVLTHIKLAVSGVNPAGSSSGQGGTALTINVPSDRVGAFIYRSGSGVGSVSNTNLRLKLNYGESPVSALDTDMIRISGYGIEMVYVPEGSFTLGDESGQGSVFRGSALTNAPYTVSSEGAIQTVSEGIGLYYTSTGAEDEQETGAVFTVPASFPKGYGAFYAMKYEVTEGQYVDFLNTLDPTQKTTRNITLSNLGGKDSNFWKYRNTIRISGSTFYSDRPDRACGYLSWMDLAAFLDWAGLRPMTEMEYEKMARGGQPHVSGEYAWGTAMYSSNLVFSKSPEDGTEYLLDPGDNIYSNTALRGGDVDLVATEDYEKGPVRVGIFSSQP